MCRAGKAGLEPSASQPDDGRPERHRPEVIPWAVICPNYVPVIHRTTFASGEAGRVIGDQYHLILVADGRTIGQYSSAGTILRRIGSLITAATAGALKTDPPPHASHWISHDGYVAPSCIGSSRGQNVNGARHGRFGAPVAVVADGHGAHGRPVERQRRHLCCPWPTGRF
jgi:hypothetical protein